MSRTKIPENLIHLKDNPNHDLVSVMDLNLPMIENRLFQFFIKADAVEEIMDLIKVAMAGAYSVGKYGWKT